MHITHIAWLGFKNYGDDVMAAAIRTYLCSRYKDVYFTLWCEGRPEVGPRTNRVYPLGLRPYGLRRLFEKKALQKTDLLLIGGGSLLHSESSIRWKQDAVRRLRSIRPSARAVGVNLSVGPFPSEKAKTECANFLWQLDSASFRDAYSCEFAKSVGTPYAPVQAFDLAASYLESVELGPQPRSDTECIKCIGLEVKRSSSYEKQVFENYARLLSELSERYQKVKVFVLCNAKYYGDSAFLRRLLRRIRSSKVQVHVYSGDTLSFTRSMRECDFLIAARYHSGVMAFLMGIPFISLSYHKKCLDFATMVGIPAGYVLKHESFRPEEVLNRIQAYPLRNPEPFYELANENFRVFDT